MERAGIEEEAAELAWARLERRRAEAFGVPVGDAAAAADEFEEAIALLALGLPPESPAAGARERLLAALDARSEAAKVLSFPTSASIAGSRRSPWRTAVAAGLIGALFVAGYVLGRSGAPAPDPAAILALQGTLDRQTEQIGLLEHQLRMVTTVARHAYSLSPGEPTYVGAGAEPIVHEAPAGAPRGVVYVCGHHQQYLVALQGLAEPPTGHEYHLWFVTDAGTIDGGPLAVGADHRAAKEDAHLPSGTHGFLISLEPPGQAAPGKLGELVLQSHPPVRL
jgi:hypothetical protein